MTSYDPKNNFDDTLNEIITALHTTMRIKGDAGVAFDDDRGRLTISLPACAEATAIRALLGEVGIPVNPVRPGQLPLTVPDAIAKGKVR